MLPKKIKLLLSLGTALATASMASANMYGAPATAQTYSVELNKTEVVQLAMPASAIVIGNPDIADVSVHSDRTIFVVGRGYGETNLVILDQEGQVVVNANVQVTNTLSRNGVRVFKGDSMNRQTFNCAPYCQPAPVLGDAGDFTSANSGQAEAIFNQVAGLTPSDGSVSTEIVTGSAFPPGTAISNPLPSGPFGQP